MKQFAAILASIAVLVAAGLAVAQDQPLRPVLIDEAEVMIRPNPVEFAEANGFARESAIGGITATNVLVAGETTNTIVIKNGLIISWD